MKIAYTIATSNYLAQAKTVADSLKAHNPEYQFYIGLVDKIDDRIDRSFFAPHIILEVATLGIPDFIEMYDKYDIFEISNAMKPFFAAYLLQTHSSLQTLIYIDTDILVFDKFTYIEECLTTNAICITPHILNTIPDDGFEATEMNFLNAGIYNAGFFAMAAQSNIVKEFIEWWKKKLRLYCFNNVAKGQYVDQIWLNYVPLYFEKVFIIRHLGFNVAYWNLHERNISNNEGKYYVNNTYPLVFYHFSGYSLDNANSISIYQNRFTFEQRPELVPLFEKYRMEVMKNNYLYYKQIECYYEAPKKKREQLRMEQFKRENTFIKKVIRVSKRKAATILAIGKQ
jgi:hypothetical protein